MSPVTKPAEPPLTLGAITHPATPYTDKISALAREMRESEDRDWLEAHQRLNRKPDRVRIRYLSWCLHLMNKQPTPF